MGESSRSVADVLLMAAHDDKAINIKDECNQLMFSEEVMIGSRLRPYETFL